VLIGAGRVHVHFDGDDSLTVSRPIDNSTAERKAA